MIKKIKIIVADEGKNLTLAETIQTHLTEKKVSVDLINLIQLNLPQYTFKYEAEQGISDSVHQFVDHLNKATGFVIVSPEYNGSIPPVLTSAMAWATRANKEWRAAFNEKPAGIASYSYTGAVNLFVSLRIHLSYIGMNVLARPIPVTPDKPLVEDDLIAVCDQLLR